MTEVGTKIWVAEDGSWGSCSVVILDLPLGQSEYPEFFEENDPSDSEVREAFYRAVDTGAYMIHYQIISNQSDDWDNLSSEARTSWLRGMDGTE